MKLHFRSFGSPDSKPPVIILHGLFGALNNWVTVSTRLAEDYQIYALDLRNHGQSPHADTLSYPEMAADVLDFMQQQSIKEAYIIGHSMGGKVAMQLAFDTPERCTKLVVVDIAPVSYPPRHQDVFAAIDILDKAELNSRKQADELIRSTIKDQSLRLFLLTNLMRCDDGKYRWRINMPAIRQNYEAISAAPVYRQSPFTKPTLFIRGMASQYIQDEHIAGIKSLFPNSQIDNIDNAGHWVHAEQTEVFLQHIRLFLST